MLALQAAVSCRGWPLVALPLLVVPSSIASTDPRPTVRHLLQAGVIAVDPLPAPPRQLIVTPPPARTFDQVLEDVLQGRR